MKKVIMGNHAISYGVRAAEVKVISAYPITPQTMIVELLSELTASGRLDAKFITVESEHSAMAACVGASAAGARAYTATSGQGLARPGPVYDDAEAGRVDSRGHAYEAWPRHRGVGDAALLVHEEDRLAVVQDPGALEVEVAPQ